MNNDEATYADEDNDTMIKKIGNRQEAAGPVDVSEYGFSDALTRLS